MIAPGLHIVSRHVLYGSHSVLQKIEFKHLYAGHALFSLLKTTPSSVVLTSFPALISAMCPAATGIGNCAAFFSSLSYSPSLPCSLATWVCFPFLPCPELLISACHSDLVTQLPTCHLLSSPFSSFAPVWCCVPFRTHVQGHCLREAIIPTRSLAIPVRHFLGLLSSLSYHLLHL